MRQRPEDTRRPETAADPDDRRRHHRIDLSLRARVLTSDGIEEPCLVTNISAGGALLKAVKPPAVGERVVLYIDNVGRFEGWVIRSSKHVFAVDYRSRRTKSKRTADNLIEVANMASPRVDRRASPRVRHESNATVVLEDGSSVDCQILDISLTGASIAIDPRPELGAVLTVGRMTAKVVRRHEKGVGVVFTGKAAKMDDVIERASAPADPQPRGPELAPTFGRKGVSS